MLPSLSYKIPTTFTAFGRQASLPPIDMQDDSPLVKDTFLDSRQFISPSRAIGLFALGLGLAFAGKGIFKTLLGRGKALANATKTEIQEMDLFKDPTHKKEKQLTTAQNLSGLGGVYALFLRYPELRNGLLTYLVSSGFGYLAGSFVQGMQETWVRREETKIRARLIGRLKDAFRQSIRIKNQSDARLKADASFRIRQLLERHSIRDVSALLQESPAVEPLSVQQRYFYEPTSRTLFGQQNVLTQGMPMSTQTDKPPNLHWWQAGLVAAGAGTGLLLQMFIKLLKSGIKAFTEDKTVHYKNIQLNATESYILQAAQNRKNILVLGGFFGLSALASVGKQVIDGLRAIEVTRVNARTELGYQTHNWLTQDPAFHNIAETEALKDSLYALERDLPQLKHNRSLLAQRIQVILTNVGRNSAPKYFPMTPAIGLVDARG